MEHTVKNCLKKIELDNFNSEKEHMAVFNFFKKFIKESDEKTREAFFKWNWS